VGWEGGVSWALGYDDARGRDIGYGVPAYCDHPRCSREIDRGLSYRCGSRDIDGDRGCGLYFCGDHRAFVGKQEFCARCRNGKPAFEPKPDHPRWVRHKEHHPSWARWREERRALRKGRP